eukprot:m.28320 g.28320  ORF g.28320 m.28320 type:complete len:507 (+) comp30679_c0_seq2:93-1613(+)
MSDQPDAELFACHTCGESCKGAALRVQDLYFHAVCFVCKVCSKALASGGFFSKDGSFYCTDDYHKLYGTSCHSCGEYVEGDVVSAAGKTYHRMCFACGKCKTPFSEDEQVIFDGNTCVCQKCSKPLRSPTPTGKACGGCDEDIDSEKVLIALDKSWHIWCFKCHHCNCLLAGEYMGKDGLPYCEKDYQSLFGVKCARCEEFITGKVLQAGEQSYHPSCARCVRCGLDFGEGEEMFTKDSDIWHPNCDLARERVRKAADAMNGIVGDVGVSASEPNQKIEQKIPPHSSEGNAPSDERLPSDSNSVYRSGSESEELNVRTKSLSISDGEPERSRKKSFLSIALEEAEKALQSPEDALASGHSSSLLSPTLDPVSLSRAPSAALHTKTGSSPTRPRSMTTPGGASVQFRTDSTEMTGGGFKSSSRPHSSSSESGVLSPIGHQPSGFPIYPLAALTGHGIYKLPKGVDRTKLEMYLSDKDFKTVFGMNLEEFGHLAMWKQRDLKKRANLF